MQDILRQKMIDGLSVEPPELTRRSAQLPNIAGKAMAVIGVRRGGKTSFMWQCLSDRLAAGSPRDSLLMLGFEDDRLEGIQTSDLSWLIEEYFSLHPAYRDKRQVAFFLDEIQLVPGWELFARRLIDTERIDLFLSGSSAKLLSREVATSMRGRALETTIYPFSFRESLRHTGDEPDKPWARLAKAGRSTLDNRLRRYLAEGGFPEAQNIPARDRAALLNSYVDVVVLRDVIERHAITTPLALRWLQRHLLSSPAAPFSIQKYHDALKSQGIAASKDYLHAYLAHLEDAFLITTVSLHTDSERKRMVNPRKAYPIDPGLIPLYERSASPNTGHALETVVLLELLRRGYQVSYVRTVEGWEVDFFAQAPGIRKPLLIQVSADIRDAPTRTREVRALVSAAAQHADAKALLLTMDSVLPGEALPAPLKWQPVIEWLLEADA
jgi:uncharacterized protein